MRDHAGPQLPLTSAEEDPWRILGATESSYTWGVTTIDILTAVVPHATGRSQRLQLLACLLQSKDTSNRPNSEELLRCLGRLHLF